MSRYSRVMSCAVGSTWCSGGRRRAQARPSASSTRNVRLDRPPATRVKVSGGRSSGSRAAIHSVTCCSLMPSGAPDTGPDANRWAAGPPDATGPAGTPPAGLRDASRTDGTSPAQPLASDARWTSPTRHSKTRSWPAAPRCRSWSTCGRPGAGRARRSGRCSRRRSPTPTAPSRSPRSTSTRTPGSPRPSRSSRSRPSSRSATARSWTSSSAPSPRRRWRRSSSASRRPRARPTTSWPPATRRRCASALELEPDHAGAIEALARLLIDRGDAAEALALLAAHARDRGDPAPGRRGPPPRGRRRRLRDRRRRDAQKLDELLERVRDDDAARQEFVDLLEAMGANDPRTNEYRRALAARLF